MGVLSVNIEPQFDWLSVYELRDWAAFTSKVDTSLLHRFFLEKDTGWASVASTISRQIRLGTLTSIRRQSYIANQRNAVMMVRFTSDGPKSAFSGRKGRGFVVNVTCVPIVAPGSASNAQRTSKAMANDCGLAGIVRMSVP